jgi:hypothetical protein
LFTVLLGCGARSSHVDRCGPGTFNDAGVCYAESVDASVTTCGDGLVLADGICLPPPKPEAGAVDVITAIDAGSECNTTDDVFIVRGNDALHNGPALTVVGTAQDSTIENIAKRDGFASTVRLVVKDWTLMVSTRSMGTPLMAGRYPNAKRAAFTEPNEPGLEMTSGSWGCNTVAGEFTIVAIHFAVDGSVDEITVNYEHHCEATSGFNYGCVHLKRP